MKKITPLILAASVLGLVGCGMPAGLPSVSETPMVVADAGNEGAKSATIDLTHAFEAQAIVHRWVKADVVNYHVTLAEVAAGKQAKVAGDDAYMPLGFADAKENGLSIVLTSTTSKARFTGLKAGKKYAAFIVVEGRKNGTQDALQILNRQQGYQVGGRLIDFTAENDVDDDQSIQASITLDEVTFSGKGRVSIDKVNDGSYVNGGPISGGPEN